VGNVLSRVVDVLDGHGRSNDAVDASHYRKKRRRSSVNLVVNYVSRLGDLGLVIGRMQTKSSDKIP
jgi:hypothetical protein